MCGKVKEARPEIQFYIITIEKRELKEEGSQPRVHTKRRETSLARSRRKKNERMRGERDEGNQRGANLLSNIDD